MNIDTTTTPEQEANAALNAITVDAKTANTKQLVALSGLVADDHLAEHIRGMVAVTMRHLSVNASAITRTNAEHWQDWALGVADGVAQTLPVAV